MKKEETKVDLGFNEDGSITLDRNLNENIYSKKKLNKTKEEPKEKDEENVTSKDKKPSKDVKKSITDNIKDVSNEELNKTLKDASGDLKEAIVKELDERLNKNRSGE